MQQPPPPPHPPHLSPLQEHTDEQEQYQQKLAFSIPDLEDSGIDSEEMEAFRYILAVREQADGIRKKGKQMRKYAKKKMRKNKKERIVGDDGYQIGNQNSSKAKHYLQPLIHQPLQSDIAQIQISQQQTPNPNNSNSQPDSSSSSFQIAQSITNPPLQELPQWFSLWKQQVITNWECVVANLRYLRLHQPHNSNKYWYQKVSIVQLCASKPKISDISTLTLGRVQLLIKNISEQHYHSNTKYYYLWMYSLLAVHRSLASYSIFQYIGCINACIINQVDIKVEGVVVRCLLVERFEQRYLGGGFGELVGRVEMVQV